jgi:hypothetical protein
MKGTTLALAAAAALAIAACADQAPTALQAPGSAPRLARTPETLAGARFISGNVSGEGNSVCRDIDVNPTGAAWSGVKVDPPQSRTINGYVFTLSSDGRFLSFTQVSPGFDVEAVLVKGGPDAFVFDFPGATTSGGPLRSPLNGGGNIPQISHYTVCFTPGTPPGEHDWTIKKEIVGFTTDGTMSTPVTPGSTITLPGFCAGDPAVQGCVVWVQYRITVTKSPGNFPIDVSAIVTDNILQECAKLAAKTGDGIVCQFPANAQPIVQVNLDGSATWTYFNDLWNRHVCGRQYLLTNTATLTESGPKPPGGEVRTSDATVTINTPACLPGQKFP